MSPRNKRVHGKVRKTGALRFHLMLTLMPGRDDDLIKEIEGTQVGQLAAKVREMMRNGISSGRFLADESAEQLNVDMGSIGMDL